MLSDDGDNIKLIERITLIETIKSKLNFLRLKIKSDSFNEIRVVNKLIYMYYDVKDGNFSKTLGNEFINTINAYLNDK